MEPPTPCTADVDLSCRTSFLVDSLELTSAIRAARMYSGGSWAGGEHVCGERFFCVVGVKRRFESGNIRFTSAQSTHTELVVQQTSNEREGLPAFLHSHLLTCAFTPEHGVKNIIQNDSFFALHSLL